MSDIRRNRNLKVSATGRPLFAADFFINSSRFFCILAGTIKIKSFFFLFAADSGLQESKAGLRFPLGAAIFLWGQVKAGWGKACRPWMIFICQ